MRILHCVESYFPSVGGMQEVVKQLSERLVKLGHEVSVATSKNSTRNFEVLNGVKIIEFEISGNSVNGIIGESENYKQLLLDNDFDIITFFAAQQWATDLALPLLNQIKAKKVSVPTGYSGLYWHEYASYFEKMKTWIKDYDMNVFLSEDYRDINFARENKVTKICLIPNGAAEDEFLKEEKINVRKALKLKKDSLLFLHVGSFTGRKGQDEALQLFLKSNAKNATLLLIGNNYKGFKKSFMRNYRFFLLRILSSLKRNRIIIDFFDREFTVAAYKQSDLFIFPSNIECSPIVLFECAASKTPFIASNVGNSVEIAKWTQGGIVFPTTFNKEGESIIVMDESVELLNNLIADENKRKQLADTAFEIWKNKYSWEQISKTYELLYLELLKGNGNN